MFRNLSIVLAIVGLVVAIYVVSTADQPIAAPPPAYPASVNPFPRGIVALGVVESSSRDIAVSAADSGVIVEVFVNVGDNVEQGQPLFRLDPRAIESELVRARAARSQAEAEVKRLEEWPREEDVAPVAAAEREAKVRVDDATDRLEKMLRASAGNAASADEISRQRFAVASAEAAHASARAELSRWTNGSWVEDLNVARASLATRVSDIEALSILLGQLTVRSPIRGTVLKRSVEPGEFAPVPPVTGGEPLIIGDISSLHVRAQIDEEDTPLLSPGARAVGRIRGPLAVQVPLTMLRIEPLARPKQQISNSNTELIDTRVVEVVFRVEPGTVEVSASGVESNASPSAARPTMYPGQVVDVFVEGNRPSSAPDEGPTASEPGRANKR